MGSKDSAYHDKQRVCLSNCYVYIEMNMDNYCWDDAWLLLAIKYAQSDKEIVTTEEVEMAGDFINHAIFEDSEIEHGVAVLTPAELIEVKEGNFKLGPSFQELWKKSGAEKHHGVH